MPLKTHENNKRFLSLSFGCKSYVSVMSKIADSVLDMTCTCIILSCINVYMHTWVTKLEKISVLRYFIDSFDVLKQVLA